MKFTVKAWSRGKARAGLLHLDSCPSPIETPALLLSTRKGLPCFITPDLLPSLPYPDSALLHLCPLHFFEGLSPKTITEVGGLHQLVGLKEYAFAAIPRDSIQCLPEYETTNRIGAAFDTPSGRRLIKASDYMEWISSLLPNIWTTLADEVPAWVSDKRNKLSVDRTVKWLDECIAHSPAAGAVFGSIVGGTNIKERIRCVEEITKRTVSGYWIGGFGLGESMHERHDLLNTVTEAILVGFVGFCIEEVDSEGGNSAIMALIPCRKIRTVLMVELLSLLIVFNVSYIQKKHLIRCFYRQRMAARNSRYRLQKSAEK